MRSPSSIFPEHFGLREGAEPVRKPKWWHQTPSAWRGEFGANKALGRSPFESLLERDFQTILSADFHVRDYAVQPHSLTYWRSDRAKQIKGIYTPDFVMRDRDGQIVVIEVKASIFARQRYWQTREPFIREAYAVDHGVPLLVFSEDVIRVQPRLANFEIMLRHRGPPYDTTADLLVRDIVRNMRLDATIGDVCDAGHLPSLPGTDRVYSALMRLALQGEVLLDLSKPFSRKTRVSKGV